MQRSRSLTTAALRNRKMIRADLLRVSSSSIFSAQQRVGRLQRQGLHKRS